MTAALFGASKLVSKVVFALNVIVTNAWDSLSGEVVAPFYYPARNTESRDMRVWVQCAPGVQFPMSQSLGSNPKIVFLGENQHQYELTATLTSDSSGDFLFTTFHRPEGAQIMPGGWVYEIWSESGELRWRNQDVG